jgi:menaquinone-dependent protoporphyrinogen oxidase
MTTLVTYASRHGATRGIAERVASTLARDGIPVDLKPIGEVGDIDAYDAFVIGSAVYMSGWLGEATTFVRRHASALAGRPVWLFGSGPVGPERIDKTGRDVLETSRPREFAEFAIALHPRDARMFFGAYDPDAPAIGFAERFGKLFTRLPDVRDALPAGDFRDWPEIEAWAHGIAQELVPEGSARGSRT